MMEVQVMQAAQGFLESMPVEHRTALVTLVQTMPGRLWEQMRQEGTGVAIQPISARGSRQQLFVVATIPNLQAEPEEMVLALFAPEDVPRLPEGPREDVEEYLRELEESGS